MDEIFIHRPGRHTRWASFENPLAEKGGAGLENRGRKGHAFDRVGAGETVELLRLSGAGVVRRIWMTVIDRSPDMLRSLLLRCTWDDAPRPAVEVPLGDFFCCGSQPCAFENALFASPEGRSFNSYVPMPFRSAARITLTNQSDRDLTHLFYDVDVEMLEAPEDGALYFHAWWNRENPTQLGRDYCILPPVQGKGRYLGTSFVLNAPACYGTHWWGEGEFKVWLDGDTDAPTLCGTGTEDFIGTGWNQGVFNHRYQGCLLADKQLRRWVFYRLHLPDPIYFSRDIRVAIQNIGGGRFDTFGPLDAAGAAYTPVSVDDAPKPLRKLMEEEGEPALDAGWINYLRQDDMASVAFFYLDAPTSGLPGIQAQESRVAGLEGS